MLIRNEGATSDLRQLDQSFVNEVVEAGMADVAEHVPGFGDRVEKTVNGVFHAHRYPYLLVQRCLWMVMAYVHKKVGR